MPYARRAAAAEADRGLADTPAAIAERRAANNVGPADVNIEEPGAGHLVGSPVPNLAVTPDARYGGTLQADAVGRLDAWPRILAFLGAQAVPTS